MPALYGAKHGSDLLGFRKGLDHPHCDTATAGRHGHGLDLDHPYCDTATTGRHEQGLELDHPHCDTATTGRHEQGLNLDHPTATLRQQAGMNKG